MVSLGLHSGGFLAHPGGMKSGFVLQGRSIGAAQLQRVQRLLESHPE